MPIYMLTCCLQTVFIVKNPNCRYGTTIDLTVTPQSQDWESVLPRKLSTDALYTSPGSIKLPLSIVADNFPVLFQRLFKFADSD